MMKNRRWVGRTPTSALGQGARLRVRGAGQGTRPQVQLKALCQSQSARSYVAQCGFAASYQRSAVIIQLLNQRREHSFNFGGLLGQFLVFGGLQETQIAGQQQVILQFTSGTASNPTGACQFRVPIAAAALHQIGADRGTGTADLAG
jgi:hypothetical protein